MDKFEADLALMHQLSQEVELACSLIRAKHVAAKNLIGTIECPRCKGKLSFKFQSNGHLWGSCETRDQRLPEVVLMSELVRTVRWMLETWEFQGRPMGCRAWVSGENAKMYVRLTKHMINEQFHYTLDVSSVEVDEAARGTGVFTRMLEGLEALAQGKGLDVFVESILEPRLIEFLRKRGYQEIAGMLPPCWFKEPSKEPRWAMRTSET